MREGGKLPEGWVEVSLGDITLKKVTSMSPEGRSFKYIDIASVDRETKAIKPVESRPTASAPSRARQRVHQKDILVSMTRPNLNAVAMVPTKLGGATASTGFDILRSLGDIEPIWLFNHIRSHVFVNEMTNLVQGALYPAVKSADVRASKLPIPPLNEQRRIVAKIEALQERSRAAKESLDAIPPLLEKFRQSVLASAFRGDLTRKWRKEHPNVEPASVLLERIRAERKARFIEDQAEKARTKAETKARTAGKTWGRKDNQKLLVQEREKAEKKYKAPEPVDESGLPELPVGWCWGSLGELLTGITAGKSPKAHGRPAKNGEFGVLKVSAVSWGRFKSEENKAMMTPPAPGASMVAKGNLLISRANTVELVGAVVLIETNYPNLMLCDKTLRLDTVSIVDKRYLLEALRTQEVRNVFEDQATGTSDSMRNLSQGKIRSAPIPIAPAMEQCCIVNRMPKLLELSDRQHQVLSSSLNQLSSLNQSILSKAFRGELVPQDPNDEPASVLLERIREERALTINKTQNKRLLGVM